MRTSPRAPRTYAHSSTVQAVLRSLVAVICPREAHPLAGAIVAHTELTLGSFPTFMQRAFAAGAHAYDLGALPRYRMRARSLVGDRAERYFASWERGITPLHTQTATALVRLVNLACYEQPEMMERVGYRPAPWIAEVTHRRLTQFRDDVRRQDAQILAPDPLQLHRGAREALAEREPA